MPIASGRLSLAALDIEPTQPSPNPLEGDLFFGAIKAFQLSTDSLIDGMPTSLATLESAARRARRRAFEFIEPFITETETTGPTSTRHMIHVPPKHAWKLKQLKVRIQRREHALRAISESFLVTLVSQFDTFIASLVRAVLTERPEVLNASDRTLTFAQLQSFKSLEDARSHLIEKEVDELLRNSHKEQLAWFEKRAGKRKNPLKTHLSKWPEFIEATERRNVIIHADARVTNQYLEECASAKYEFDPAPSLAERLEITLPYFREAYEATTEVGLQLGSLLWLHFKRDDAVLILNEITQLSLDYMSEGKFTLARRLSEFALDVAQDHGNDSTRKIIALNVAQGYKWEGDQDKMKEVLNAIDWSSADLLCRLALAILRDQWTETEHFMRQLAKIDGISPNRYRTWPIFHRLRRDPKFKALFVELYGEPITDLVETVPAEKTSIRSQEEEDALSPKPLPIQ